MRKRIDRTKEQEYREAAERLAKLPKGDMFRQEARRLALLPARDRREALDVHRRIADDARFSEATRNHARYVADTLETSASR